MRKREFKTCYENRILTQESYDKEQVEIKAIQLAKNEQGVKDGLLVKIGDNYYDKETIALLCDYTRM